MSSKGSIGLKRFSIDNNTSMCTTMPKPTPKKNSKHLSFGDSFVNGIHAEVMSTSNAEKVEIFSWSEVRIGHLIDKISNVPLDSLVKVTIHAGVKMIPNLKYPCLPVHQQN